MARKNPNVAQNPEPGASSSGFRDDQQTQQVQKVIEIKKFLGTNLLDIKPAALSNFDSWQETFLHRIAEAVCGDETDENITRVEVKRLPQTNSKPIDLKHWSVRIDTPLASMISSEKLPLIIHAFLLLSLSLGSYDPRSRTVLLQLCNSLNVPVTILLQQESSTAHALIISSQSESNATSKSQISLPTTSELTAQPQVQKRIDDGRNTRRWKIGLASVAGAVVIGVTGGLAAPLVAAGLGTLLGGIGLGGTVAAGYLGAMAASAPLVGGLFGAYGGKMSGDMMKRYANEVRCSCRFSKS